MNTDSVHIVCSSLCVNCTITDHTAASLSEHVIQHAADDVTDDVSRDVTDDVISEPYTSDSLSRLRTGYKLLSAPSCAVKFNFNSQQVSIRLKRLKACIAGLRETSMRAMGQTDIHTYTHGGIRQCYLPPNTSECAPP